MGKLKRILFSIFLLTIISFFSYLFYDRYFSDEARICNKNLFNAKSIKVGMTENEVVKIMGKPEGNKGYSYLSDNIDYETIDITFDSHGKVSNIFIPKYK